VPDERFALFEAQISVFLGLDAGRNHHGGPAVAHHVADLAPQRAFIHIEAGGERSERRNDQSGLFHCVILPAGNVARIERSEIRESYG
jgi:hypothetical protein